jgi:hypothetical protein
VTILPILAKWYLIFEDFIKKEPLQNMQQSIKKPKAARLENGRLLVPLAKHPDNRYISAGVVSIVYYTAFPV